MKIKLINNPKIIMENPDSRHNYFGWPTVARLKDGTIIAGASGYRIAHICPFGKGVISYSYDNGETYTAPKPIFDTPLDDRDVGLCLFGENGVIATSFNNTKKLQEDHIDFNNRSEEDKDYIKSHLEKITEEDEKTYLGSLFRISNDGGKTFGEIYKSPVSSPHGPIELNDGSILWVGNVFEAETDVAVYKINLDGSTQFVGEIENVMRNGEPVKFYEPYAFCLENGRIIAHIRAEQKDLFSIYQSVSDDNGKTWTKPICIMPEKGGAPSHIMKHSSGMLICSYSYRGCAPDWDKPPYGIKLAFSSDNGKTWDYGYEIFSNPLMDLGYPSTVELDDGSLLTVFYAHPDKDSPAVIYQQKWSFEA